MMADAFRDMGIPDVLLRFGEKSPLQAVLPELSGPGKIVLVHNTFTDQSDHDWAEKFATKKKQQLFWCFCPRANLYIEGRLPDVQVFFNKGKCVIGTDSLASNWSLSILEEIKVLASAFPGIKTEEWLKMATMNGAEALGVDHLGKIKKGMKPGLILIRGMNQGKIVAETFVERLA